MRLADVAQPVLYMVKIKYASEVFGSDLKECVASFNRTCATDDEVKKAVETMFLHLYGSRAENLTLGALHYIQYRKSLKRNAPKCKSLPSTSANATFMYAVLSNPTVA